MSFHRQPYLLQLYMQINEEKCRRMVVEKSVQCGLSELFVVNAHIEANSGLSVMYIFPKYALRDRFVTGRVKRLHNRNPFYVRKKRIARRLEGANRLSLITFGNGIINFVGSNVSDEFFEFPADSVYIDEKDLCDQNNLQLVPGRLTASKYKFQREISNPTVDNFGIDARYLQSTCGKWHVRCEHCNHWFSPDLFLHLLQETGTDTYRVLDSDAAPGEVSPMLICDRCCRPVDRLGKGEWVHEYEDRAYRGFRISQLFSPKTDLGDLLWEPGSGFFDAIKTSVGKQVFFNTRLGLPFSASDARITEADLDACQEDVPFPFVSSEPRRVFVGVDVGKVLNVVIRERRVVDGEAVFRLCHAAILHGFAELSALLKNYPNRICVVDALPEGHSVSELKGSFQNVYSCMFLDSAMSPQVNRAERTVKVDRTTVVDSVKRSIDRTQLSIPRDAKNRIPSYYAHLTAPTRILEVNDTHPDKSRFRWVGAMPDHYLFAEVYCRVASLLAPHSDVFDAYARQNEEMKRQEDVPQGKTPEQLFSAMHRKEREKAALL